jgi:hypothetical protein
MLGWEQSKIAKPADKVLKMVHNNRKSTSTGTGILILSLLLIDMRS